MIIIVAKNLKQQIPINNRTENCITFIHYRVKITINSQVNTDQSHNLDRKKQVMHKKYTQYDSLTSSSKQVALNCILGCIYRSRNIEKQVNHYLKSHTMFTTGSKGKQCRQKVTKGLKGF